MKLVPRNKKKTHNGFMNRNSVMVFINKNDMKLILFLLINY
jgi:hypothetical protein